MTIGESIKEIRKKKGYTQKQLGKESGIAEITIRQYEAGKYKPKLENIRKIASVLGVYMNELIEDWSQYSPEELGQDFANESYTFINSNNIEEQMLDLFILLNGQGQEKALEQVELITKIPEYQAEITKSKDFILELHNNDNVEGLTELKAAHERTDTEVTDEMRKYDDDIMNDEDF